MPLKFFRDFLHEHLSSESVRTAGLYHSYVLNQTLFIRSQNNASLETVSQKRAPFTASLTLSESPLSRIFHFS